ncbi:hypothetical protein [Ammonifex thiophilus]|uniref:Conjugal transfer protein TrbC n=1 Tax=Ammonifex thiophilus TaxID=444093 RepID=A0A3D8P1N5_9THEO|nr:hypothetical protein [Ammonifex thiophilus]RDV81783.1 hypothetical protein DXX99_08765 [Ammonifex thiophilus]
MTVKTVKTAVEKARGRLAALLLSHPAALRFAAAAAVALLTALATETPCYAQGGDILTSAYRFVIRVVVMVIGIVVLVKGIGYIGRQEVQSALFLLIVGVLIIIIGATDLIPKLATWVAQQLGVTPKEGLQQ